MELPDDGAVLAPRLMFAATIVAAGCATEPADKPFVFSLQRDGSLVITPMSATVDLQNPPDFSFEDFATVARKVAEAVARSKVPYEVVDGDARPEDSDGFLGPLTKLPAQPPDLVLAVVNGNTQWVRIHRSDRANAAFAEADRAIAARDKGRALDVYNKLVADEPGDPKAWLYRGELATALGQLDVAGSSIAKGLELNPADAFGHLLAGELAWKTQDRSGARRGLCESLSLFPNFAPAVRSVEDVLLHREMNWRPFRAPIKLSNSRKQIVVQLPGGSAAPYRTWGLCEAVMRFDIDRRGILSAAPAAGVSWHREVLCLDAMIATAAAEATPADPQIARLIDIGKAGYVREAALYDVIGPRRPDLLALVSAQERQRLVEYVDRFVVGAPKEAE
jgi:hypothetical protein